MLDRYELKTMVVTSMLHLPSVVVTSGTGNGKKKDDEEVKK